MSTYSTGELAKAAGVTVRTVQYYDSKGILIPYDYSEGGRRVYTDEELEKLKFICFLKELGFSLGDIATVLSSDNSDKIIETLLEEQKRILSEEIKEKVVRKEKIVSIQRTLKYWNETSTDHFKDMAQIMSNKKNMEKVYKTLICVAIPMEALEVATFMIGIFRGTWLPYIISMALLLALSPFIIKEYLKRVVYICPECHEVFKPGLAEFAFSSHTTKTRKLKCPHCNHKSYCIETYDRNLL